MVRFAAGDLALGAVFAAAFPLLDAAALFAASGLLAGVEGLARPPLVARGFLGLGLAGGAATAFFPFLAAAAEKTSKTLVELQPSTKLLLK